jgi:membrane-bound lytic murein transglycosylase A
LKVGWARWLILLSFVLAALAGGALWWLSRPGPLRLARTAFADLPGWEAARPAAALASFRRACAVLTRRAADTPMGGAGYGGTAGDWRPVCAGAVHAGDAKVFFTRNFTPYAVRAGHVADGLFTGYYEPEIAASRTRHGAFQTPVYGLPPDLVRADLGLFDEKLAGEHISGRLDGHRLVPYPARAAIDADGISNAPVLMYAKDPVAFFFLQIQGSGRARLDDGSTVRIAYAGENGRPYTAIGRTLLREGALEKGKVSLQSIRAWLAAHPGEAQRVLETNQSYVFFEEKPLGDTGLGSQGTLGVPLTPLGSLAVDRRRNVLGAPYYVAASGPDPVHALLIAEDTGGAIRGPVRGDIFFGFGPEAEQRAGKLAATGQMFVLLPNALAARLGASFEAPP